MTDNGMWGDWEDAPESESQPKFEFSPLIIQASVAFAEIEEQFADRRDGAALREFYALMEQAYTHYYNAIPVEEDIQITLTQETQLKRIFEMAMQQFKVTSLSPDTHNVNPAVKLAGLRGELALAKSMMKFLEESERTLGRRATQNLITTLEEEIAELERKV